jgi:hypothetical protein
MNLPAGGTYHGQVACNKAWTTYNPQGTTAEYACDDNKPDSGTGAMHTTDKMGDPNPKDVKGCGLSIAYESDVHKLKPEDFTVISVSHSQHIGREGLMIDRIRLPLEEECRFPYPSRFTSMSRRRVSLYLGMDSLEGWRKCSDVSIGVQV